MSNNTWISSVKNYCNENNSQFVIPKKNSELYDKVKEYHNNRVLANECKQLDEKIIPATPKKQRPKKIITTKENIEVPVEIPQKKLRNKKANEIKYVPENIVEDLDDDEVIQVPKMRKPRSKKNLE